WLGEGKREEGGPARPQAIEGLVSGHHFHLAAAPHEGEPRGTVSLGNAELAGGLLDAHGVVVPGARPGRIDAAQEHDHITDPVGLRVDGWSVGGWPGLFRRPRRGGGPVVRWKRTAPPAARGPPTSGDRRWSRSLGRRSACPVRAARTLAPQPGASPRNQPPR